MINENELQLVVSEKNLGSLTTNAKLIKEKVEKALENFKPENYSEDNIDEAKTDKAMLNNTSKSLNDERIKIEKEFMQPFAEFKETVKDITDMIKDASSKIDSIVKTVDEKAKNNRKHIVETIFEENVKELKDVLNLNMIFDDKWLNKSSFKDEATFKLEEELLNRINTIRKDLLTIGDLKSDFEIELKNDYLKHFDLGEVIRKNNELIQKQTLLKDQFENSKKIVEEQKEEKMLAMAEKTIINVESETETYTLKISGTRSQMIALKTFLTTNDMAYEKL